MTISFRLMTFGFLLLSTMGVTHSYAALPAGYPAGYYKLENTHNGCVNELAVLSVSGESHYLGVGFGPGHETCDMNYIHISHDGGLTFRKSGKIGHEGCTYIRKIVVSQGRLYVEVSGFFLSRPEMYESRDDGKSFFQI